MTKYIAILRGINVGGRRKILMADLRKLLATLDFSAIQTYIQSGNVIFETPAEQDHLKLAADIEQLIVDNYDFAVPVIVRSLDEWQQAVATNPFYQENETDIEHLHLTFLKKLPEGRKLNKINTYDYAPDQFNIIGKDAFVYCSGRYSASKLTNKFFESKLKVTTTTRNWKTVLKLLELSQ